MASKKKAPRKKSPSRPSARAATLLRSPGAGLLTISTGSAAARDYFARRHAGRDISEWPLLVRERLQEWRKSPPPFFTLGVPSDSGGGIRRGAAHGPLALRNAAYSKHPGWADLDIGDVPCIPQLSHDDLLSARQLRASGRALWDDAYRAGLPVSPLNLVEETLVEAMRVSRHLRPFVIGGDHSVSGPVFNALARLGRTQKLAVLHFDAHTDLLESRFGVDHCFGTWTAHAVKLLSKPAAWAQVGIRASRHPREHWEARFGLRQHWAADCLERDPEDFARELVAHWRSLGCTALYVTNDVDATDAASMPATGTPEPEGLSPGWVEAVIRRCSRELPLAGADLMELAPVLGSSADAARSVDTAVCFWEALDWSRR
jgi:agmatinase